MNSKERFDFYSKMPHFKATAEEFIMDQVNLLIRALYIPVQGYYNLTKLDPKRMEHFKIDDAEPINWGDLKCIEVVKVKEGEDDYYKVVVDEAAPNDCPTFCAYLENMMASYGWNIKVETEW